MSVFEKNRKKREIYKEKFLNEWDLYAGEKGLHHRDDEYIRYDFHGEEQNYLNDAESYLGWYLKKFEGNEHLIPEALADDYSLEIGNVNSIVTDAMFLFYQTACNLKESLEVNDFLVNEYEDKNGNGRCLQFYFRTTNHLKELEEIVQSREIIKDKVQENCEKQNIEFNEQDFNDELYTMVYGNFYENGDCDLFLESQHYLLEKGEIFSLMKHLDREEIDTFWDKVKQTIEWKEFEESFEIEKER